MPFDPSSCFYLYVVGCILMLKETKFGVALFNKCRMAPNCVLCEYLAISHWTTNHLAVIRLASEYGQFARLKHIEIRYNLVEALFSCKTYYKTQVHFINWSTDRYNDKSTWETTILKTPNNFRIIILWPVGGF